MIFFQQEKDTQTSRETGKRLELALDQKLYQINI